MKLSTLSFSLFVTLFVSQFAFAGKVVSTPGQFPGAAATACEGRYVGADCTIEFAGGHIGFGVCVEVPNGGGQLTCNIDVSQLPPGCQNNALGTKGSALTFASLAVCLLFLRRKKRA